ncbi:NAD(P)/FAD-dependent oxidoreductase [Desulfotalea psychrophila]|uniref:Related to opine/octopine dehydrogenase, subunit A n=1 Tax=Desulfotalea psychrophila (strain LSv54 / DSM 12343) TaxID=177439 RepID=Q6AL00_DESPS|nr:NAD(P)/FAD-dependent oxidoreductase [Desulfotalea psychrophila]CAG36975.1 related to opine/octopine dehydrogenase, subunit A [Desulfotalea psychrophila LSv54]
MQEKQQKWDVAIVGAGPAGLSCAITAAKLGLDVILLDDQNLAGGQIYRWVTGDNAHKNFLSPHDREEGAALVNSMLEGNIRYIANAVVWHGGYERLLATVDGKTMDIRTQYIVIATGAMERPVPFKGWTLPNVMTAGSADLLYKTAGMTPDAPVVIAGNGPLVPLVAGHLLELGVPLAGILETMPLTNLVRSMAHMPKALQDIPFLFKGVKMTAALLGKTKYFRGVSNISAHGDNKVERVQFSSFSGKHSIDCSTLLVHEGLIPRTHVSRMFQLEHVWDKTQRYWYPLVNQFGKSSNQRVYVVGDCTKVHGIGSSTCKGEMAALDITQKLGKVGAGKAKELIGETQKRLQKAVAPRDFVDSYFAPRKGLFDMDDSVTVCRCENVSAGDIRRAVQEGCQEVNDIKLRTRCGMGPCQGRMCGSALAEIAAKELGRDVPAVGALNIRTPVRPVSLENIMILEAEGNQ